MTQALHTPVAFFIFRRPKQTQSVFDQIAREKPSRLLIVADGPRNDEEEDLCQATRAVVNRVDWPCEVLTNFSSQNLGLRARISSGLDWVFQQVEEAIILEDDCLPHPTFFRYCAEMLDYYRFNEQVMHISGDNFGFPRSPASQSASYYFSRIPHIWGWATWKRAWSHYDMNMSAWREPSVRQQILSQFSSSHQRDRWARIFDLTSSHRIETWDYQWVFSCLLRSGLCTMPYENQISNIGMDSGGTNTQDELSPLANLPTYDITFPLVHPDSMDVNEEAVAHNEQTFHNPQGNLLKRLTGKGWRAWKRLTRN